MSTPPRTRARSTLTVVVPVVLAVLGSGAALVLLGITWARVAVDRDPPFADVAADVGGRTLAPAVFGLALVTAAGAVALLATRGVVRRVVGAVVALAGLGAVIAACAALAAPGDARARDLAARAVAGKATGSVVVPIDDGSVQVTVHAVWPVLAAVAAALTVVAGVLALVAGRGAARGGLGARYEAPVAASRPREQTLWSALDHGEDPTTATGSSGTAPDQNLTSRERDPDRSPSEHTG